MWKNSCISHFDNHLKMLRKEYALKNLKRTNLFNCNFVHDRGETTDFKNACSNMCGQTTETIFVVNFGMLTTRYGYTFYWRDELQFRKSLSINPKLFFVIWAKWGSKGGAFSQHPRAIQAVQLTGSENLSTNTFPFFNYICDSKVSLMISKTAIRRSQNLFHSPKGIMVNYS